MLFNRNEVVFGRTIEKPSQDDIKNTMGLWNASVEDAIKFGGDVTRAAIQAMNLRGDYKHIVVDVKTHMLMPNMIPAIPGWHTDGVPRGADLNPASKGDPNIYAQETMRSPRYHLLVTGGNCPTRFIRDRDIEIGIENGHNPKLYSDISAYVKLREDRGWFDTYDAPDSQVVEWDWWELHTAQRARGHGWRYLIRVTETDHIAPQKDLRQVLRTQQQVYMPTEVFGW
ncbi:hypothetical protein KASHIRA_00260 [Serratia phage vB_SmaM-Kashira]|nr:hypothetical protein KASHIRA_00260 [Serratia phage vB_SmaM-Kashira]